MNGIALNNFHETIEWTAVSKKSWTTHAGERRLKRVRTLTVHSQSTFWERRGIPSILTRFVRRPRVRGAVVHHARVAALCLAHGVQGFTEAADCPLYIRGVEIRRGSDPLAVEIVVKDAAVGGQIRARSREEAVVLHEPRS